MITKLGIFILIIHSYLARSEEENSVIEGNQEVMLPPCLGCKTIVSSFKNGLERTEKGNFSKDENASEKQLLEQRLVAIKEQMCAEIEWGQDHCKTLSNEMFPFIEDWWLHKQDSYPDLHQWLCVLTKQLCCPEEHFGPDCKPCPGHLGRTCSNNGKCKGAGTRKGNGLCMCDTGYSGDACDKCAEYYYQSYRDETKLLCSPCHESCRGTCSQAGPKGCVACKVGWQMDTEKGCLDVDECYTTKNLCKENQFCVNNEGSYMCLECDRSCKSCHGDGPDMCIKCARGYTKKDNMCVDEQELGRNWHVNVTRYLMYAGLCIATCIIFQKSMLLAGLIGLSVGIYISVAEYYLGTPPDANNVDVAKILGLHA